MNPSELLCVKTARAGATMAVAPAFCVMSAELENEASFSEGILLIFKYSKRWLQAVKKEFLLQKMSICY